ncbi:hypothetical protein [Nostoc sp. FACHB-133]|uniref:hypothetical protein n=1 Tax=Nostoc sp. FACHB-133 TaxID=2692835 RepID=UPI0018F0468A|nr:hypothetical protein [Nostoc sp. FACHB-133]
MDPVTIFIIAAGFLVFSAMIYFFLKANDAVKNAERYKKEVERMNHVIEVKSRELEKHNEILNQHREKLERLENQNDQKVNSAKFNVEDLELKNLEIMVNQVIKELDNEKGKWKKELSVATTIYSIAGTYNKDSALTLISLIVQSLVLGSHLLHPDNAIQVLKERTNEMESRLQNLIDKVDNWVKNHTNIQVNPQTQIICIEFKNGKNMGNYKISGGNQGAVGDQAQASDFTQINESQEKQSLADAANEIQQLLKELEKSNPTSTDAEKIAYINDKTSPNFKKRAIRALKAAGESAIEEFLDNPYINVGKAAIKGWMQPE